MSWLSCSGERGCKLVRTGRDLCTGTYAVIFASSCLHFLKVRIDADGNPTNVTVVTSSDTTIG